MLFCQKTATYSNHHLRDYKLQCHGCDHFRRSHDPSFCHQGVLCRLIGESIHYKRGKGRSVWTCSELNVISKLSEFLFIFGALYQIYIKNTLLTKNLSISICHLTLMTNKKQTTAECWAIDNKMQILKLKLETETITITDGKQAQEVVSVNQAKPFKQLNIQVRVDWKVWETINSVAVIAQIYFQQPKA